MGTFKKVGQMIDDAVSIIIPDTCEICGRTLTRAEKYICLGCNIAMPRTNIHKAQTNRITERLSRSVPDARLASWFIYRRGSAYASMIHSIKYRDRPKMGRRLAEIFSEELIADNWFDGIDMIVPVPMHFLKRLKRGYNQSREIASGVSRKTGIPVSNNLYAKTGHISQTRFGFRERVMNISSTMFGVRRADELNGKHILIVDDVITTGATIEGAATAMINAVRELDNVQNPPLRLSILSLALTSIT